jgi:hypothetical protein
VDVRHRGCEVGAAENHRRVGGSAICCEDAHTNRNELVHPPKATNAPHRALELDRQGACRR